MNMEIDRLRDELAAERARADALDAELRALRSLVSAYLANDGSDGNRFDAMELANIRPVLRRAASGATFIQATVPASQDDARDAERYRACRYIALADDNDSVVTDAGQMGGVNTPFEFDAQIDKIAANLAAKEK